MNPILFIHSSHPLSRGSCAQTSPQYGLFTRNIMIQQRCNHPRPHSRCSVLQRLANDPFYGLTDDGDFAIFGVNVEEVTPEHADKNNSEGYLSSLMSSTSFSGLLNDNPTMPAAQSTGAPAGDAMSHDALFGRLSSSMGANDNPTMPTAQPTGAPAGDAMSLNDALFGRLSSSMGANDNPTVPAAQSTGAPAEDAMSLNDALFGRLSSTMGSITEQEYVPARDNVPNAPGGKMEGGSIDEAKHTNNDVNEEMLLDVQDWLLTILPKLNQNDMEAYARGLCNIGFHPECVTMCEMKYDDLDFMKVLHRRYIFNEVTGVEHPWEV